MIGYAGTGYKGMQINNQEKTIEGDIFKAFIAAGAISKANADDPKKSSLVRCARTDKGVHAAGNVISLKLIVEEPDIVKKINENLPPQIRVWGIERTNGSFSCYQTCDSRWYEYLIPTYSFLPPRPQSFLGKKLVESAEQEGSFESYQARQQDVASFWKTAEEVYAKPILDKLDPDTRAAVMAAIDSSEEENTAPTKSGKNFPIEPEDAAEELQSKREQDKDVKVKLDSKDDAGPKLEAEASEVNVGTAEDVDSSVTAIKDEESRGDLTEVSKSVLTPLEQAIKDVKAAYLTAKKAYRISDTRRKMVEETLSCYIGTQNFHNYTIQKSYSDPSAKRVIRSFKVGLNPIIINDTEWLSLKVHGQSFMMHQIRKMVAMAALVVRCGASKDIIKASYGPANISIPKAPALGLLLERPVFDSYNEKAVKEFNREKIDFDKYQKEIDEFKQREIYDRMFRDEERDHQYVGFLLRIHPYTH
jgi:tRNA pseudouridine38-40 synthase